MIKSEYHTLTDTTRSREIPLKTYHPKEGADNGKTVIFSHGLGGSRDSYQYYAEFLAAHGFTCHHPTHIGIDDTLLKDRRPFQVLKEAASHPENYINPPLDVRFVADHFALDEYIMAGHSFGSYTTLVLAGQPPKFAPPSFPPHRGDESLNSFPPMRGDLPFDPLPPMRGDETFDTIPPMRGDLRGVLKDNRITCAIAMSPHAVNDNFEAAYGGINIPILHITGKHDDSPFGFFEPIQRRIPFDHISHGGQYLMIFNDADHMVFAAQRRQNKFSAKDVSVMKMTCEISLEFLRKYSLKSKTGLDSQGFHDRFGAYGIFEKKL